MPLLAEGFWKDPNVYDVAGVLGLIIGIVSIWLAKRDIDKRIAEGSRQAAEAAREEVRRVARALLQGSLTNAIRFLELSREAAQGKRWGRALDRGHLAREQLARVLAQPGIEEPLVAELRDVSVVLISYLAALSAQAREGAGVLAQDVSQSVSQAVVVLHAADARLTAIRLE